MTQQSVCQQLTQSFDAFLQDYKKTDLDEVLRKYSSDLDDTGIIKLFDTLAEQQKGITTEYQKAVVEMLSEWYSEDYPNKARRKDSFLKQIEFDDANRVIINGDLEHANDLDLQRGLTTHFPSIIKRITGSFWLGQWPIRSLDYLEEVDGDCHLLLLPLLTSAKRLRKIGGYIQTGTTTSNLEALPELEELGIYNAAMSPNVKFPKLKTITDEMVLARADFPGFQVVFPKLRRVGKNSEGYSFLLPTTNNETILTEIHALKDSNQLQFSGGIGFL